VSHAHSYRELNKITPLTVQRERSVSHNCRFYISKWEIAFEVGLHVTQTRVNANLC